MRIDIRFFGWVGALSALVGLGQMAGCTTDDNDAPAGQGGATGATGGSGTLPGTNGGAGGGIAGTGGSTPPGGLACAKATVLDGTKPGIANFDDYDGAPLASWPFALGGDSSTSIYAGPFGYGDRANGLPETFDMTAGHSLPNALTIADSMAMTYGGGMGLWISSCLDASVFTGISFWVRGVAPTGTAKLSIMIKETTATTPLKEGYKTGTCPGVTDSTCIHPKHEFEVKDAWAKIQVPWDAFTPGKTPADDKVQPNGSNIWQVQFDIGLQWGKDATGADVPIPAAYELAVDDLTFY